MPRTNIPITANPALGGGVDDIEDSATAGDQANDHSFVNDGKTRIHFIRPSARPWARK